MSSEVKFTNEGIECRVNDDLLIKSLITEENELLMKIKKSRDNDDFGLYKNLIRALTDVTTLKQRELDRLPKETWKDMCSHYWEGKELESGKNEYVATWEQKGDDIRNHKIYKVEKEVIPKYILEDNSKNLKLKDEYGNPVAIIKDIEWIISR